MKYSDENIRIAILAVMVKEPGKRWKKEDLIDQALAWLEKEIQEGTKLEE